MSTPKYFIENVSQIDPNKANGIVKLTFGASSDGGAEEVVQLIVSVGDLQGVMQKIGETMQKAFGGGGGQQRGNKGGPPQKGGSPFSGFRDLTKE